MSEKRDRILCPSCARTVIIDSAAQSIAHADPVCGWFEQHAQSVGELPEVRHVEEGAVDAHLDALRARVRNRVDEPDRSSER